MPMTPEQIEAMLEKMAKTTETLAAGQTKLTESLNSFQKDVGDAMKSQNNEFQRNLQGVLESVGKKADDDDSSSRNPTYNDEDLESLSRKEFMAVIANDLTKSIKPMFEELQGDLNKSKQESARDRVQREYKELSSVTKDLDEWQEEMKLQVKKNPLLSVSEAYTLARNSDMKKAAEMDKKYPKEEPASQKGKGNQEGGFGGMRPDAGHRSEKRSDMTSEEASESAWEDIFGGREQELLTGDIPITADDEAA